jgi:hypothetical protein
MFLYLCSRISMSTALVARHVSYIPNKVNGYVARNKLGTPRFHLLATHWHERSHVNNRWPLSEYNCKLKEKLSLCSKHHAIKANEGMEVKLCTFFTLAPEGGEISITLWSLCLRKENPPYPLDRKPVGLRAPSLNVQLQTLSSIIWKQPVDFPHLEIIKHIPLGKLPLHSCYNSCSCLQLQGWNAAMKMEAVCFSETFLSTYKSNTET